MAPHPVRNTNDGTQRPPYLRTDFNLGNLSDLPPWSEGPRGDARAIHLALKQAGYLGVQGGDVALCRELGLGVTASGRVNEPGEIAPMAARWRREGYECATLHVGWGHESDAEIDALVGEILAVSHAEGLPLYIETHRATITQDTWRTVQMIHRHPDVRINADFSHWFTGLEMPYGDIQARFDFLAPVFERVRFFHGRIGNSSHIQLPLDHPSMPAAILYFREMWTRAMAGFLRGAAPGDFISFNPELLHPAINYAPVSRSPRGSWEEGSDRWLDAARMTAIATECFAAARQRVAGPPPVG
jgi:hypothetical protein